MDTSMKEKKISDFENDLASKAPVPGGGGASALVGSLGMALGNMVGSLTVGKKKYANVEEKIKKLMDQGDILRNQLLDGIDKDAEAFAPLAEAYGIPKDDPDRAQIMEKALIKACEAPMDIMNNLCQAIDVIGEFAAKGSAIAISDAGVGVVFCKAALQGASLNVFINTKLMKDVEYAQSLEDETNKMLGKYCRRADKIYEQVISRI